MDDDDIRATCETLDFGSETALLIADPDNGHAWIQSTATSPVRE